MSSGCINGTYLFQDTTCKIHVPYANLKDRQSYVYQSRVLHFDDRLVASLSEKLGIS